MFSKFSTPQIFFLTLFLFPFFSFFPPPSLSALKPEKKLKFLRSDNELKFLRSDNGVLRSDNYVRYPKLCPISKSDLTFYKKMSVRRPIAHKVVKPDQKSGFKFLRESGPTPVARGGCGAKAPPLAARPRHPMSLRHPLSSLKKVRQKESCQAYESFIFMSHIYQCVLAHCPNDTAMIFPAMSHRKSLTSYAYIYEWVMAHQCPQK